MSGKSLVLLLLAVASGLGAMFGTSKLLSSKAKNKAAVELQDVIVAARDLKVEETLKPDLVKIVQMTKSDVPAGAFSSFKDVEERWVMIKTLVDEPILDKKLAPKGTPAGIVPRIPKGMRAFTLAVDESTGVSGFVLPDHRVDVVVNKTKTGSGEIEGETILQDILVLASGTVFNRPEDRNVQSRGVTLAVTPEQAEIIVAAREKGKLALSLRGLNDREQMVKEEKPAPAKVELPPPPVVAVKAVEPTPPPPPPAVVPAPPMSHIVHIYRGVNKMERVRIGTGADSEDEEMIGFGRNSLE